MTPYSDELYGVEFLCVLFGIRDPHTIGVGGELGISSEKYRIYKFCLF